MASFASRPSSGSGADVRAMILGCGLLGSELAKRFRAAGHHVLGTTTTESKVPGLRSCCDEVAVVRGDERARIKQLAANVDVIAVTVSPRIAQAVTKEQRLAHYSEVLVESCLSAAAACPRSVFCSSFSVFGDGLGQATLDESSALSDSDEPSTVAYRAAERAILANDAGTVLRLPDIYGAPGDMSFKDRLALAHKLMGGKVPFAAEGRLHRIHVLDVVRALEFVVAHDARGLFHVCDDGALPPTNQEAFDALSAEHDLPRIHFRGELKTPTQAISMAKLRGLGFALAHVDRTIA